MEQKKDLGDLLREAHKGDWKTFFKIYNWKTFTKSKTFQYSLLIGVGWTAILYFFEIDSYEFLKSMVELHISILPSLLGFSMGAYALLLTGFTANILRKVVDKHSLKYNSLQKTSSVFGMILLVMAISLTSNYLVSNMINLNVSHIFSVSIFVAKLTNISAVFVISVLSTYSIFLTANSVINLFAFSQFLSGVTTVEVIESDLREREKE